MTKKPKKELAINLRQNLKQSALPQGKTVIEYTLPRLYAPDGRLLSENISLSIHGSGKVCITGDNGSGKTTLIKAIASELLERKDIKALYMPQNYEDELDLSMTPVDYLDKTGQKEERSKIQTFLSALRYTVEEMSHPISALSGGQKAKILILRMVLSDANVLILDEPTRNFSALSAPAVRELLKNYPGAIISISHDRKFISAVAEKVYRLCPQGLIADDSFREKSE